jgi:hypothetical protein
MHDTKASSYIKSRQACDKFSEQTTFKPTGKFAK